MSVQNPLYRIPRRAVEEPAGEAGLWAKMFDPPNASPATPEFLNIRSLPAGVKANPVPSIMEALGLARISRPFTLQVDLLHGQKVPTWDGREMLFYTIRNKDIPAMSSGAYPGLTIRVPQGSVFHAETQGHGPPPHTIHWHGIEPTPFNDGVGHCSMEIGTIIYQWQPNFCGTYFYHCHRNTVQHFEFGLFGALIITPPDSFHASVASMTNDGRARLNDVPVGACSDGRFRTSANVAPVQARFNFPNVNVAPLASRDPLASTVAYDVEALWVLDDRDSLWAENAPDARAFFPKAGNEPGVNDRFVRGFFNDYNADYWYVTGVPVPAARRDRGGTGIATIDPAGRKPRGGGLPGGVIPAALNSGVSGTQVAIDARVGQTVLVRTIDAAYNHARISFPIDVAIVAFDGRALGVEPFGLYNASFTLPANTPILLSTARRFDALLRSETPFSGFATVEFHDTQGYGPASQPLMTARIPITIR